MKEEWRDIKGYENLYQISNYGRVKSFYNNKEQVLKNWINPNGYLLVTLCKNKKKKKISIHRLVAETFLDNPCGYPQINHKDEDKTNNYIENLEWCDAKYNNNYGTKIERQLKLQVNHPKKSKEVICLETGVIYPSSMEAERQLNIRHSQIIKCCLNKSKTAGGFTWKYTNKERV